MSVPTFSRKGFKETTNYKLEKEWDKELEKIKNKLMRMNKGSHTENDLESLKNIIGFCLIENKRNQLFEIFHQMISILDFKSEIVEKLLPDKEIIYLYNIWLVNVYIFLYAIEIIKRARRIIKKELFTNEMRRKFLNMIHDLIYPPKIFKDRFRDEVISLNELKKITEEKTEILSILLNRNNFIFTPNKKYHDDMFEFTIKELFEGKKKYVAIENTLKKFDLSSDPDSYRKMFDAYLKNKKTI